MSRKVKPAVAESSGAARHKVIKEIAECYVEAPSDAKQYLAEAKAGSRQALLWLLDHVDVLPERERVAVLIAFHGFLYRLMTAFRETVADRLSEPLVTTPRLDAYADGKSAVFKDSFFG